MSAAPPASSRRWILALVVFGLVYVGLYLAYLAVSNEALVRYCYYPLIVEPGAALVRWLAPSEPVRALGNQMISGATTLEIVRGCDGAGVLFLMIAAVLAAGAPWRRVAGGLACALMFVYAVNQVRIVVLYFVLVRRPEWFVPLHTMVFPGLFIILGLVGFALWIPPRAPLHAESALAP